MGPGVDPNILAIVSTRAETYRYLLEQSLPLLRIRRGFSIAIDVSDLAPDIPDLPLFSFQKPAGSPLILLPDIDLLLLNFLEDEQWTDRLDFEDKQNKAIFVGASTGGHITREEIDRLSVPRLRAAVYFKDNPRVAFTLSSIVQYDTLETKKAVEALGVGGPVLDWNTQLGYRHILSMDGNGATWSRVAKILNSNSVLMKYDSPFQLFYFRGLRPWTHYVPITCDAEVEAYVLESGVELARYRGIAEAGRRFFDRHLRRDRCLEYVAALLQTYMNILDAGDGDRIGDLGALAHYTFCRARRQGGRAFRSLRGRLEGAG